MKTEEASQRQSINGTSPVERGYPFVGILPNMLLDAPGELARVALAHPNAVPIIHLGPARVYLVTHPDHAQYVLNDNWRNFGKKGRMWDLFRRLLGNSLSTTDGEVWRRSRRLIQPLFTAKHLASLVDIMTDVTARAIERLEPFAAKGRPVDMDSEMMSRRPSCSRRCSGRASSRGRRNRSARRSSTPSARSISGCSSARSRSGSRSRAS
jgi:hypothetical protein